MDGREFELLDKITAQKHSPCHNTYDTGNQCVQIPTEMINLDSI
jgi:hypothetical protein